MLTNDERGALKLTIPSALGFLSEIVLVFSFPRNPVTTFLLYEVHFYWLTAGSFLLSMLCIMIGIITSFISFSYLVKKAFNIRPSIRLDCWMVNLAWFLCAIWEVLTIDPMPRQH